MSFNIQLSDKFSRSAKQLAKKYPSLKNDLNLLRQELAGNPEMGTPLGKNLYKIRMPITSKGRGKSGGARVITCVVYKSEQVLLAEIYDKAQYDTVDDAKIIKMLKDEGFDI
jgi:mRNA-degrading endonuclease RelE of RelBE toxin-antitoxin system